jgi:thioredoxin
MTNAIERVGPEAFDGTRLRRSGAWAVAFLADWCPFCQEFSPRFSALAVSGVHLLIADLSSAESPLWDRFDVEVVPTVVVFRDGSSVARFDGRSGYGLDSSDLASVGSTLAGTARDSGSAEPGTAGRSGRG